MADLYIVTVEAKDGSFAHPPEGWDTKEEALDRCEVIAPIHLERGRVVSVYECRLIQSFGK